MVSSDWTNKFPMTLLHRRAKNECLEENENDPALTLPLTEKGEIKGQAEELKKKGNASSKNRVFVIAVCALLPFFSLLHSKRVSSSFPFIHLQCNIDSFDIPLPPKRNPSNNDPEAHVVYAADHNQLRAMRASLISLLTNTESPHLIHLHMMIVSPAIETDIISPTLEHWIRSKGATLHYHHYNETDVSSFMNPHITQPRLNNPDNFVRFILADKLSNDVEGCLWLDADTIVNGDVIPFFRDRKRPKHSEEASYALSAFPMVGKSLDVIDEETRSRMKDAGANDLAPSLPSFNAGVLYLNLEEWRKQKVTSQLEYYSKLNVQLNLWPQRGSQPPLQLTLGGDRFEQLDEGMYADCLGCFKGGVMKRDALFLHWNGAYKPWKMIGKYKSYWRPHDLDDLQLCLDIKKNTA